MMRVVLRRSLRVIARRYLPEPVMRCASYTSKKIEYLRLLASTARRAKVGSRTESSPQHLSTRDL